MFAYILNFNVLASANAEKHPNTQLLLYDFSTLLSVEIKAAPQFTATAQIVRNWSLTLAEINSDLPQDSCNQNRIHKLH
jgi:hypothetical protein